MFKNVIGLIVEYNPFHNGHLHHIQEIDRLFEDNIKIAVMSGDFVQRGEPSLINKFEKTKIALSQGIDIVIELPAFYSTQSAEIFAKGSVNLLNKLSCSHIVFGSESNDLDKLKRIATISLTKEFELSLREFLAEGFSYPTAFSKALFDEKLGSNDILAMEYLKAIKVINPKIEACSIKREKTGYYDDEKDNFASATYIRKFLLDSNRKKEDKLNKIKNLVPEFSYKILEENFEVFSCLSDFYDLIKYNIIKNYSELKNIQDLEVGSENRLYKYSLENLSFEDFFNEVLTKRITISRLQRILLHSLFNLTENITEKVKNEVPFVKILGFSTRGQEYLNYQKKLDDYNERKILTSNRNLKEILSEEEVELFNFNELCSHIYRIKSNYINIGYPIIKNRLLK
ncbi:nucleotidyltransferase family protein [Fusobacterium polymorphum]|uniref:tRNA(Met) cytidine acetate ligase n=1 Tax=Fusobacterium nucleatum subsp. polymorphum TaxID=76857 RepID=UPI001C6EF606|nr:nucleotidyltransferase family protein [Fusobacterium polymorphum]QYR60424.1 nucleotidyltransferase family protein [Fusobacterium polymorphum]